MKMEKMKKLIYFMAASVMIITTACDDVLDTDNLNGKSLDTFYATPTDIDEAMGGVYNALYMGSPHAEESIAAGLMSDLMLAGGGPDDISAKNVDKFEDPGEDTYKDVWVQSYKGIARSSAIIEQTPDKDFTLYFDNAEQAQAFKDEAVGEAHFMRAFNYFRLAKYFGGVPMIVNVDDPKDVPRSTLTETYAQITTDLLAAIEMMSDTPFPAIPTERYGHANKWVAQAYLARVYLQYTGYMTNMMGQATSDLPLADGGTLSKSEVLTHLNDCINNSGHQLASDFRNLWPYSYVNEDAGSTVLPWAANEGLAWVGQEGHSPTFGTGNYETMFVKRFSFGDWGWWNALNANLNGQSYTNRMCLFSGIRDNSMVPFGQGWGWCPINPIFYNSWDDADPRKQGSVLEMNNADQGTDGYVANFGDHETDLFNKKYTAVQHSGKGMFIHMYDWGNTDMQLMHAQDFIFMRFADVLLMHSEISETADGMNQVRNRAGLGAVGYSLDALKEERMHELAFEGLRWFDIVRWGDVNTVFNYTVDVRNTGTDATYTATYRQETMGLCPIPESEIRLANGAYEQNPGW